MLGTPFFVFQRQSVPVVAGLTTMDVIGPISAENAGSFDNEGIYLCRPDEPDAEKEYYGSVNMNSLKTGLRSFRPTLTAVKLNEREKWDPATGTEFTIDVEEAEYNGYESVKWHLREDAPAAVYGIECVYVTDEAGENKETKYFRVVYTDEWTYICVKDDAGERRTTNFQGGEKTLYLNVTFNPGATNPSLKKEAIDDGGIAHSAISDARDVVSLATMDITVKTLSGSVYKFGRDNYDIVNDENRVKITFPEKLGNDVYIVQFTSNANQSIMGQYIIDNTQGNGGVNMSGLWAILMIFGGVLTVGASVMYLVPFAIVKINEARVNKENERVDRMKNPEKYAESDQKSLKGIFSKLIYNIKTPAYERNKNKATTEEGKEKPVVEKVHTNKFTEMLSERQERREFMRKNNVTSEEMDRMKEAEEEIKREEASSFVGLRDDDEEEDEIATFHAAEDEISTLETGSYTEGGATFAKLDSIRDDESVDGNDNDGK